MKPKSFETDHGVTKLALEAGVSVTTASRKLRSGKTPEQIIQENVDWKAKQAARASLKESGTLESKFDAESRKERALADLKELELATKSGELVHIGEVNAYVAGMILRAREILTRIPTELQDRLAQETDPVTIAELIATDIDRALANLSEYRKK